jgi:hypothetical protein
MNVDARFSLEDLPELASLSEMSAAWGIPRYTLVYIADQRPVGASARHGNKRLYDRDAQEHIARRAAIAHAREQIRQKEHQRAVSQEETELTQMILRMRQQDERIALLESQNAVLMHQTAELLALVKDLRNTLGSLSNCQRGRMALSNP